MFALTPVVQSEIEIENQMRWIAKGYALVYENNPVILNFLYGHLSTKEFYEDAQKEVNPIAIVNISLDLEDEVYNAINTIDPNNDYNRDFFIGFEFENCIHVTKINVVDDEDAQLTLPVLFTYENKDASDTTWGYFWNNGLDSILLHSQNYEDYFIFGIFPEADCNLVERRTFRQECEDCCNDDGRCEPMQGETPQNCPDCVPTPMPWEKELKVEWIRIDEDKHPFDKAWIQGKYEIIWDFVIANLGGGIIQNNREITFPPVGTKFDLFNKWKRKELSINRRSLKGSVTEKEYGGITSTMYDKFNYATDDIYILVSEADKNKDKFGSIVQLNNDPINLPSEYRGTWHIVNKGGTFHKGGVFPWGGIIHIPANSTWVTEGSKQVITASSPHGEITIKLSFIP